MVKKSKKRKTEQTVQKKLSAHRAELTMQRNRTNSSSNGSGSRGDATSVTIGFGAAVQAAILTDKGCSLEMHRHTRGGRFHPPLQSSLDDSHNRWLWQGGVMTKFNERDRRSRRTQANSLAL